STYLLTEKCMVPVEVKALGNITVDNTGLVRRGSSIGYGTVLITSFEGSDIIQKTTVFVEIDLEPLNGFRKYEVRWNQESFSITESKTSERASLNLMYYYISTTTISKDAIQNTAENHPPISNSSETSSVLITYCDFLRDDTDAVLEVPPVILNMYNRNDNAYGDERRRWNADDRYTQSSRYQDTGISSGLRGNDYQSRQSLMSTNYDDIRYFNANSGRVALLQENEMRRQETLERRSDSYGSGGQYGGFRVRGDRPRKSVYDEGPYHRQETERYPPRREEPLRGRGLLGEPEQQFLRPQPNMVHQMESEAKLALANTLINALVQSQQQPVLPTPAPWMAQPLMVDINSRMHHFLEGEFEEDAMNRAIGGMKLVVMGKR
ncbi:hypothetical protein QYM36_005642, partial [Artemia franciscana]